jgi:hypothetical protein
VVSGSASSQMPPRVGGRTFGAASNSATSIRSARSPFQNATAIRRTSRASISLAAPTSSISRAVSSSSSDGASSSSTRWCMAARPCFSALAEERRLPFGVTGPRERTPLRREASTWAGLRGRGEGAAAAGMAGYPVSG